MTKPAQAEPESRDYFAVQPEMIFPDARGEFEVYLFQGGRYVLYLKAENGFSESHCQNLLSNGIREVYVKEGQKRAYDRYVKDNLGDILANPELTREQRAGIFLDTSREIIDDAFSQKLPASMTQAHKERVMNLVRLTSEYLSRGDGLKALGEMIRTGYHLYTHSLQVLIYTAAMLHALEVPKKELIHASVGAVLHDIGLCGFPKKMLSRLDDLDQDEWQEYSKHTLYGVALLATVPLEKPAIDVVMFHHEREDGSGFPSGIGGKEIPLTVKAVALADVYDRLTTGRPGAPAMSPYKALKVIQNDMSENFSQDVYKKLVHVLSGAGIIE